MKHSRVLAIASCRLTLGQTRWAGAQVASLAGPGDLEARLKAAEPRWRAEFCSDADRPPGAQNNAQSCLLSP